MMGLHILWTIVTYHRPGEPLTIQRQDLIPPVEGGSGEWSVLLFPGTRAATRKNQSQDEGLSLTNKIYPWLPKVIAALARGAPQSRLFPHSYHALVTEFNRTRDRLRLGKLVLYQCRHSGASLDLQGRHRDHLELKKRGGWQCESSLRRYENAARLNMSAARLQPWQVAEFKKADDQLEDFSFGRVAAAPLQVM